MINFGIRVTEERYQKKKKKRMKREKKKISQNKHKHLSETDSSHGKIEEYSEDKVFV